MKVIFLDVDGVLNSQMWAQEVGGYGHGPTDNEVPSPSMLKWDPAAVRNLRKIVDETGAKVVISSSWRGYGKSWKRNWRAMFHAYGWAKFPVIGETPDLTRRSHYAVYVAVKRGEEVSAWIAARPKKVTAYVCIDDDRDFLEGQPLVQTDNRFGLTMIEANRAIKLLNGVSP